MRHGRAWWKVKFTEEGIRFTQAREAIMEVLTRSSKHMSAEDIYVILRDIQPSIGFATVYRTLDLLTKMGMVIKLDFGDGRARYEIVAEDKTPHYHLICSSCGRVTEDYGEEGKMEEMKNEMYEKYKFKTKNMKVYFLGTCYQCQKGGE
jgi:Fur family transcriptional regulator, ferric uptake regulator